MKKILITLCLIVCLLFISDIRLHADHSFDDEIVTAGGGTYQVTERVNYDTIDYGIKYTKDIAKSSSSNLTIAQGSSRTRSSVDPQVVNVLEVPTSSVMKVVNWTYSSNSSWTKASVTKLAQDFENQNPGWVVIAGINGDFFDINGNGALQYQTTGAAVNNGEVVRAISSGRQVGFTNNGSTDSLIGGKNLTFTDEHILSIYDENDDIIKTFTVDKFNEAPTGNEIAVYFSYYTFEGDPAARVTMFQTAPSTNSYIVQVSERSYAPSSTNFYGKGSIDIVDQEKKLYIGQFAIVTNNEEVKSYLGLDVGVRIQQDIVGDYADCDNISGCGATLVDNGEFTTTTDGMSNYAHPRTVIGQKADGTIVLATVDGRQEAKNMYGMTYEELSAMMMYYDCTEAYNLDGGGSTTMIIRNAQGGFDVMNSPSDGNERSDSNAILVVVPEMKLSIDEATDTTAAFSYIPKAKDIEISDVRITVTGENYVETKQIADTSFEWTNLKPNTEYQVTYSYKLNYKGNILENTSRPLEFKTGVERAKLVDYYYEESDDMYIISFKIEDPNNTLVIAQLKYEKESKILNKESTVYYVQKTDVTNPNFNIHLVYNVQSSLNTNATDIYEINLLAGEDPEPIKKKCGKKDITLVVELLSAAALLSIVFRKRK